MSEILERLYLGSSLEARNKEWLEDKGVTHILNVAKELPEYFPGDFVYKKLPCEDHENFKMCKYFNEILDFLDLALEKGTVLVHCMMGISRSASTVVLYLMARKGFNCAAARRFVKARRSFVSPNKGFVLQLVNYEMLYLKREKKATPLTLRHATIVLTGRQSSPKKKQKPQDKKVVGEELAAFLKTYIKASSDIDTPIDKPLVKSKTMAMDTHPIQQNSSTGSKERTTAPLMSTPVKIEPILQKPEKQPWSSVHLSIQYKPTSKPASKTEKRLLKSPTLKLVSDSSSFKRQRDLQANRSAIERRTLEDYLEPKLTNKERAEFFNSRNTTDCVPKLNRKKKTSTYKSLLIDPLWHTKKVLNKEDLTQRKHRMAVNPNRAIISPTSSRQKTSPPQEELTLAKEDVKVDFSKKFGNSKVGLGSQDNCLCIHATQSSKLKDYPRTKAPGGFPTAGHFKLKEDDSKKFKSSGSLPEIVSES